MPRECHLLQSSSSLEAIGAAKRKLLSGDPCLSPHRANMLKTSEPHECILILLVAISSLRIAYLRSNPTGKDLTNSNTALYMILSKGYINVNIMETLIYHSNLIKYSMNSIMSIFCLCLLKIVNAKKIIKSSCDTFAT